MRRGKKGREKEDSTLNKYNILQPFLKEKSKRQNFNIYINKHRDVPPVLSFFGDGSLVAAGHFGLVASLACGTDLNGSVLKRSCCHGYLVAALSRKKK